MKNFFISIVKSILRYLADRIINKFHPTIIGITGSVGKSSAKEAIYMVLSENFKTEVWKSEGNLNNELGLPLTILGFKENPSGIGWIGALIKAKWFAFFAKTYPKYLILEYASDKPGDIQYLTSFAKPKIAVITYVGEAHMEFFDSIDQIALEKSQLVKSLVKDGVAVLNSDNDYAWRIGLGAKSKVIYFGTTDKATIKAKDIKVSMGGTQFVLHYKNSDKKVNIKAIGRHQVYAVLAALCVGSTYNLDLDSMLKALENYSPLSGRDSIIKGINNSFIFDSSYNANLTSTKAVLETLKELKTTGRKIVILGDMLELGKISEEAHKKIVAEAKSFADKVVTVGPLYKNNPSNKWFPNSHDAADFLKDKIEKNDIILVKGSHKMEMDKIVKTLTNTNGSNTNEH